MKENKKEYCTAIIYLDGRIQLPVNEFLRRKFNAKFVDTISRADSNLVLAEKDNESATTSILN